MWQISSFETEKYIPVKNDNNNNNNNNNKTTTLNNKSF
jgi:hypothetical protein